jgi:signal transduction histidine kinase
VRINVADDGRGFPFHGRYALPRLVAEGHAPWSLTERVTALGGELAIESSPRGARIEIRLPGAS